MPSPLLPERICGEIQTKNLRGGKAAEVFAQQGRDCQAKNEFEKGTCAYFAAEAAISSVVKPLALVTQFFILSFWQPKIAYIWLYGSILVRHQDTL